jgi:hypothetical protein
MASLSSDLRTLSHEAFVYFYPLVIMDYSRRLSINSPETAPGSGPPNAFHHMQAFPTAEFRAVVRPNFDTLYSSAWLDLTGGPLLLGVPDTDDRYFMLPMLDMWTDVFANPGKRTTGTAAQTYVLTGPGFEGKLPAGLPVITAPTPYVWIIGRTQTNGPDDYPAVHRVQNGYSITALGTPLRHTVDRSFDLITEPVRAVNAMSALDFLSAAAELLAANPPHTTDFSQLARLAGLGIEIGKPFPREGFSAAEVSEIEAGQHDGLAAMTAVASRLGSVSNGWMSMTEGMGVYGNSYLRRAAVAMMALGANPAEDAVYPILIADADGASVDGTNDYVLHFDAAQLPPVDAFWSVTMYDTEGYQVANEIGRYAIGDRDPLVFNADGSLDLYLQHGNPGPDREANWLPAPNTPLSVTMRLYAPRPEVLDGTWSPPALRRA